MRGGGPTGVTEAGSPEARSAVSLGAAAADGSHVPDVGAERGQERGLVDLGVVGQDDHRVVGAQAVLCEGSVRPIGDDLEPFQSRLLCEEPAGVDQQGSESGAGGERRDVLGHVAGTDDPHPWSGPDPIEHGIRVVDRVDSRAAIKDARGSERFPADPHLSSRRSLGLNERGEEFQERCRRPARWLDEDFDRAAAHEPHLEPLVIGDAVAAERRLAGPQDGQGVLDHVSLDAAAAH